METRTEPAGAEVLRWRGPGSRSRQLPRKRCSQCSHSICDVPGPMLGAFVRVKFYLISFQVYCHFLLGNMSLSCFRKSTGDRSRGAAVEQLVSSSFLCSPPRRCDEAQLPQRGCHGPRGRKSGQVCSLFLKSSYPISTGPTLLPPQPAWPRQICDHLPAIPLHPRKDGDALVRYVNTSGKLCLR